MNRFKLHGILLLVLALATMVLAAGGCGSSSTTSGVPGGGEIEANNSFVRCQVQLFREWSGGQPLTWDVLILESENVGGLTNYTMGKIDQQILVQAVAGEDTSWLMLGMMVNANIELKAGNGDSTYYISNIEVAPGF